MRATFLREEGLFIPASLCVALGPVLALGLREAGRRDLLVDPEAIRAAENVVVIGQARTSHNVAHVARDVVIVDDDPPDEFECISVKQAAETLGVSGSAVTANLRRRSLHGRKDGRAWRVCAQDVSARARGSKCLHD